MQAQLSSQQRVLAFGLDAAEPSLTRRLIDEGELPTLESLLENGAWAAVDASGDIGSGAAWPTFITGRAPSEHGLYFGWAWDPGEMACESVDEGVRPAFWEPYQENGGGVGVLDVPYATARPVDQGFEVSEWGPHHQIDRRVRAFPDRARQIVASTGGDPFSGLRETPLRFVDAPARRELVSACLASARRRAELAIRLISETRSTLSIIGFTEIHHAAHQLWYMVEPGHRAYAGKDLRGAEYLSPGLVDVYREVDHQVGRVIEGVGPDAVMAFSAHGMRPGYGVPTFLEPLLVRLGFAVREDWSGMSWRRRGYALFSEAKRRAPSRLKSLYHDRVGDKLRHRIAQPTMIPAYDWPRTRAFALPTDQHGYIRINLAGREALGAVPERDYEATCDEVEAALMSIETIEGEPLVRDVLRPARESGAPPERLPDLIAHWTDAATSGAVRIASGSIEIEASPARTDMNGQHTARGLCVVDRGLSGGSIETIPGQDLHRMLIPKTIL